MSKKKSGDKKTTNGRGAHYVLDKNGDAVRCPECHQKIRVLSQAKQLTPEQIAKREARIQKMQSNLEEIKRISE